MVLLPTAFLLFNFVTYSLLASASSDHGNRQERIKYSSWTAFWYTVATSGAFYFAPLATVLIAPHRQPLLIAFMYPPIVAFLVDVLVLQARLKPCYWYAAPMLAVYVSIFLVATILWMLLVTTNPPGNKDLVPWVDLPARLVLTWFALLIGTIPQLFFLVGLTRLHFCFARATRERSNDIEGGER